VELFDALLFIGGGLATTLLLLIGGIGLSFPLGTLLAVLRHRGIGRRAVICYVSVVRGTPLLLQLSFIYFLGPSILGVHLDVLEAGIIAFGLNSAAYVAEILRSGIESLPRGQFEAARTLKISPFYTWKDIILPQVVRSILPAMAGEIIALLKETALIATIGGADLMRRSQMVAAEKFTYFLPLCIAGCYYYALVYFIERGARKLEKRLSHAAH
jgi:polar amino acid transport system permease protein